VPIKTVLGGCFLALCIGSTAVAEPLRLAANSYPPYTDQRLVNNGLAADIVNTALQRSGYATEYHEVPWARALNGLQHDRYDVLVTSWYAADREAYALYSEPYLTNRLRLFRQTGKPIKYEQLSDLEPYVISVVRGYVYSPAFDNNTKLQKYLTNSFDSSARMLAKGRVQLTVEDELVAQHALNNDLADIRELIELVPKPLAEATLHILVRRSHSQHQRIIDDFNSAMRAMRQDGTYAQIIESHAND
jgi:polar amino acid transport system substrate-binding protein